MWSPSGCFYYFIICSCLLPCFWEFMNYAQCHILKTVAMIRGPGRGHPSHRSPATACPVPRNTVLQVPSLPLRHSVGLSIPFLFPLLEKCSVLLVTFPLRTPVQRGCQNHAQSLDVGPPILHPINSLETWTRQVIHLILFLWLSLMVRFEFCVCWGGGVTHLEAGTFFSHNLEVLQDAW